MDVCVEPAPPLNDLDADDPAAEEAFYSAGLKTFSAIALRLADQLEHADEPALPEKVEILDRLARVFRRNARLARYLREKLRTPPSQDRAGPSRRLPRTANGELDLTKVTDEQLEALERLEELDRLEALGHPVPDRIEDCRGLGVGPFALANRRRAQGTPDIRSQSREPPASQPDDHRPVTDPPPRNWPPTPSPDNRRPATDPDCDTS